MNHGFAAQQYQQVTSGDAERDSRQNVTIHNDLPRIATDIESGERPSRASNSRTTLLLHLADDLRASIVDGDLEAARIAHEAIGRLLGSEQTRLASVAELPNAASDRGSR
jgi:hypothetical protein